MTQKTQCLSSMADGEAILNNGTSSYETPRSPLYPKCQTNQRQIEGALAHYRNERILTESMITIVDGFLGWTTEFLSFVLTGDAYALIDEEDIEKLSVYRWYLSEQPCGLKYAVFKNRLGEQRKKYVGMHRLLLGFPKGMVDHKNGNTLDNRKDNLRVCTNTQNQQNARPRKDKRHSQYKGVTYNKRDKKFQAQIRINTRRKNLGCFKNELDAARAYDAAALKHFGEFARINFPDGERNEH